MKDGEGGEKGNVWEDGETEGSWFYCRPRNDNNQV